MQMLSFLQHSLITTKSQNKNSQEFIIAGILVHQIHRNWDVCRLDAGVYSGVFYLQTAVNHILSVRADPSVRCQCVTGMPSMRGVCVVWMFGFKAVSHILLRWGTFFICSVHSVKRSLCEKMSNAIKSNAFLFLSVEIILYSKEADMDMNH